MISFCKQINNPIPAFYCVEKLGLLLYRFNRKQVSDLIYKKKHTQVYKHLLDSHHWLDILLEASSCEKKRKNTMF